MSTSIRSQPLDPGGTPASVMPGLTLTTPGLSGSVTGLDRGAVPASSFVSGDLQRALDEAGFTSQAHLQVTGAAEQPGPAPPTTAYGEPAMILETPAPPAGYLQVILHTDESGVAMWSLPRSDMGSSLGPLGATRRYYLRRKVASSPRADMAAADAGALAPKFIHVFSFPWNPIGGVATAAVDAWEKANRAYRVRTFTPTDYNRPQGSDVDWASLAKDRTLLIVHGTYSLTHTDFGRFPAAFVQRLYDAYNGRIFAFDHPTLVPDPKDNVDYLVSQIPAGASLRLDVLCHSRGGLVSRWLAERVAGQLTAPNVSIEKLVFIATPNLGTVLTDTDHLIDYINSYTNMWKFGGLQPLDDLLRGLLEVLKLVAAAATSGLRGLESMRPDGAFLSELNTGPAGSTQYFALGADFEPPPDQDVGFHGQFSDQIDAVFGEANDSIVPTNGVWLANGNGNFPIAQHVIYPDSYHIDHGGFFTVSDAQDRILQWLTT